MSLQTCKDSLGMTIISESKVLHDPKLGIVSFVVVQRVWLGEGVEEIKGEER